MKYYRVMCENNFFLIRETANQTYFNTGLKVWARRQKARRDQVSAVFGKSVMLTLPPSFP